MAARQTFSNRVTLASATEYFPPGEMLDGNSTEAAVAHRWLGRAHARFLRVDLDTAPGLGASRTFTFRVNSVGTDLTLTIADTETSAEVATTVDIEDGDRISLQHTLSGATVSVARISLVIDNAESRVSCYGDGGSGVVSASATWNQGIFTANGWGSVGTIFTRNLVPLAGTLTRIAVNLTTAPGLGKSIDFEVYVNGVPQSLGLSVSGAATSAMVTCAIALVAGDFVYILATRTSSPADTDVCMAYRYETDADGVSIVASPGGAENVSSFTTSYTPPRQFSQDATEADVAVPGGLRTFVLRDLYVYVAGGIFATDPMTLMVRKNSGATALSVTSPSLPGFAEALADPDLTDSVSIGPDDTWDVQIVMGDSFNPRVYWAFVQEALADPEDGVIGSLVVLHFPRVVPAT